MSVRSKEAVNLRPAGSQRERAYKALRQRLITLDLQPGSALEMQALMRELAIGRTPLNEATLQLAREDFLSIHPRQGTVVVQPSVAFARHIMELRNTYEGQAARLAATRKSDDDLRQIVEIDERLRIGSNDLKQLVLGDLDLHLRIAQAAGNSVLTQSLDHLLSHLARLWFVYAQIEGNPPQQLFDHTSLIAAIDAGDPDAAEAGALAHIQETNDVLLTFFGGPEPNRPKTPAQTPPIRSTNRRPSRQSTAPRSEIMRAASLGMGLSGLAHVATVGTTYTRAMGGQVNTALHGEPDTLDPHRTNYGVSAAVFGGILEPLVAKTDQLTFEGILAESWDISDDGLEYTFRLRQGIAFHDDSPFDADSVVFTFERFLATSSLAFLLAPLERIEAIDRFTVRLVLSEPLSPLLDTISAPFFGMLPPGAASTPGNRFGRRPVGTGPWMLKEWVAGDHIALTPNPHYQNFHSSAVNRGAPMLDELTFRFLDIEDQLVAFETGDLNVIALQPDDIDRFRDDPEVRLHTTDGGTVICYLDFAMQPPDAESDARFSPPFDDIRVRQALGMGFDADAIVARVLRNIGTRSPGPIPSATFAYRPEIANHGFTYDPGRAAELLADAGWIDTDGDGIRDRDGKPLELLLWTFELRNMVRLAEAIRDDLARIGIRLRIETYDAGKYVDNARRRVADLHLDTCGWPDPDFLYLLTQGEFGIGLYRDSSFQELVLEARRTTDLSVRADLYFEAAKRLLADAAMIPIATYIGTVATRRTVQNFKLGPQGIYVFEDAYVSG